MSKIVLIDGHSILNRAFFGIPDLTNSEGLHTNAVYGFLNIMFKIVEEEKPDYLTVAFDVHAPTFRHEMFAEYKGTRKPMADELREQVPLMKELLGAMNIKIIEKAGLEADDILGTLARRFEARGFEVVIISGDRDLLQLATEHTEIRIPKTKRTGTEVENYYASDVKEKYLVTPTEFIDVKALMGDASDNIPGVPGVGEKTATKLIADYGSIENVYEHAAEVKPPRAAKNIVEFWEQAKMSKVLATICVDADFPFDESEAKYENPFTEEAFPLFQRLQFKNYLSRFEVKPQSQVAESFAQITDKSEVEKAFSEAREKGAIGLFIWKDEENSLPLFADLAAFSGLALSVEEKTWLIKTGDALNKEYLKAKVEELLAAGVRIAMCDVKENLSEFPFYSAYEGQFFDPIIAAYLLNPLKNDYTWQDIATEHLKLLNHIGKTSMENACFAAYVSAASVRILSEKLAEAGMKELFEQIEMPLLFVLYRMERCGLKVEKDALAEYGKKLGDRIVVLEKEIHEEAGETFNINSPKQLGVILFEKMQLPGGKKTKTGYSTAADVLDKLAPDSPFVQKILEYRQLSKLKSTYADGLASCIDMTDQRIHCKFNQTITATGRISSTEPNLQNIPVRMELGKLIRKVFVPEKGYLYVDADYSQIELRILAHCSGDESLIRAYKEQKDIHRMTASQVFHTPFEEVTDLQRRNAKAVNFGIVYGISSFGLSQDLSISRKEAQEYIERYFETYPGIKTYLDSCVKEAKELGYVRTIFGRRRPMPEIASGNFMQRQFGERVAMNAPIQGAAADIMKIAMIDVDHRIREAGLKSKLVLQVHDELLIETSEDELEQVESLLSDAMMHAADLRVPLEIDLHTGRDWYEAK